MSPNPADHGLGAARRWPVYTLLIAVALGQAAGKILSVNSWDLARLEQSRLDTALKASRSRFVENGLQGDRLAAALASREAELRDKLRLQRPFLSANDRSRWMAIRAIAEHGDHEIDRYIDEPTWDTIDMVQHPNRDGDLRLYSSKPPLPMVLLAGPYWLLMQVTGRTLGDAPYELGRAMLLVFNGGALLLLLTSVARTAERLGRADIDRLFAVATACFGTLLSAFTPVLNNHLFGAAAAAAALDAWLALESDARRRVALSAWCGLTAAMAAACELPALLFAALLALALVARRPAETLTGFAPAALVVAAGFFGTNYWAHGELSPPYAHRSATAAGDNWYDYEYTVRGKVRDSYWRNPRGIDRGEPSVTTYALHCLVGHHGVLSLTPVWLVSLAGVGLTLGSRDPAARRVAWLTLAVTAACLVFYIGMRPQEDRNYGGMTCGLRWLLWLAPLWIAATPAAAQRMLASRLGTAVAATLLAASAMSAAYPTWNPWTQPWLYRWMEHLGL